MKQFVFLAVMVAASSQLSSAAACSSGSLADYISLGSSGCMVGTETISNFQVVAGTAGATAIAPASITITPASGDYSAGFLGSTSMTATFGSPLEAVFTYQISGASLTNSNIGLAGSSETADGAVTYLQNFCANGVFGPGGVTGCSGTAGSLGLVDGVLNTDTASIPSASFLSVTDDFTLDGGLQGSATGGLFADVFTATPEPATFFITALAFGLAATLGRKVLTVHRGGDNKSI